jgi:membrane-associated protease RseP (regulator of RpoE activity)
LLKRIKTFLVSRVTHPDDTMTPAYYFSYYARPPQPTRPLVPLVLFMLTILSTLVVGAFSEGANPYQDIHALARGVPFSFSLIFILGMHECGHYMYSRKWGVDVTLPYFIPVPFGFGTLGAIIKIRGPIPSRGALLEIGAAGPLAGFIAALPVIATGLSHSQVAAVASAPPGGVTLGDPLLFTILARFMFGVLPAGHDVFLTPMGLAGWIGLLVTMLNLLPLGQLDGGHIAYAVLGKKFKYAVWSVLGGLLVLGFWWPGWWVWAVFVTLLVGHRHPRPLENVQPLTMGQKILAGVMLVIFIVSFIPIPFSL